MKLQTMVEVLQMNSPLHYVVEFALKSAVVEIIGHHKVADGDTIFHVKDVLTGHCDFVGSSYIKQIY